MFVALKFDGVERLLQKLWQIKRTMKVRSYDAESLVYMAHWATHDLSYSFFLIFTNVDQTPAAAEISAYAGRAMRSLLMRDWSVVRFMPRRAAAPAGPPTTQSV